MLLGTVVEHKIVTYYGSIATLLPKRYLPPKCHSSGSEGGLAESGGGRAEAVTTR